MRHTLILTLSLALPASAWPFDPWAGDLAKDNPAYVRVLTYNVLNAFPAGTSAQTAAHERILTAIQPDVISYQEMDPGIGATLKTTLERVLGGTWHTYEGLSDGFNVNVVASRWPQSLRRRDTFPASSFRGTTIALIDLPNETYPVDLYFMAVHFACCAGTDRDAFRQRHADAIAAWMGDARQPGGNITLPTGTPMAVVGDFNFNDSSAPGARTTLLTGAIADTATFGPPVKGDWDGTDLGEALPLDPYTMRFHTFSSAGSNPGSWLDRFYYTDSVATVAQAFVLNTLTIPAAQLASLGLQSTDTQTASDHLPVVVDFAFAPIPVSEAGYGELFVTEFQPDPTLVPDADGEWFELFNASAGPVDMNGWILRDSGSNLHVLRRTGGVVVPPKSHFVFGLDANPATNGGVPVDYAIPSGFRLANGADTIELYRGSIKIDGIEYNSGAAGMAPANRSAGPVGPASARAMQGLYFRGATQTWGNATTPYNAQDRGTPGTWNETSKPVLESLWIVE